MEEGKGARHNFSEVEKTTPEKWKNLLVTWMMMMTAQVFVCIENENCSMCVIYVCLWLVACGVWNYVSVYEVLL